VCHSNFAAFGGELHFMFMRLMGCLGAMLLVLASVAPADAVASSCCVDCPSVDAMSQNMDDSQGSSDNHCSHGVTPDCCRAAVDVPGPLAARSGAPLFAAVFLASGAQSLSGWTIDPATPPPRPAPLAEQF
jgi:hypothetical protein